jgi:hypothetical protein
LQGSHFGFRADSLGPLSGRRFLNLKLRGGHRMMQIRRDGTEDFTCAHCGAVYEVLETPAHDSGSAACEVCDMIMMKWVDSAIALFRAKGGIEDAKRRYFFPGPSVTKWRIASR